MTAPLPERGGPQLIPRPPTVRPGGAPPWSRHIGTDPAIGPGDVRRRFADRTIDRSLSMILPDLRRSAVAALLSGRDDGSGLEVLLTRRAWTMRTHRGEVSFAGGTEDPGDEFPIGTALREASEEVGLDPAVAEVVGALDPLTTFTSDRVVVPVVVLTGRRPVVVASPVEVDAILHVPIVDLLDPACYHEEIWTWGDEFEVRAMRDHPMHFFDLVGDTVWGATANMLHQLLTTLLGD